MGLAIPSHHEMRHHAFQPASYGAGRLYYQGDIPILELDYADPRKAGEAHGYLLGRHLHRIIKAFDQVKEHIPLFSGKDQDKVHKVFAELSSTIPKEYLEEMEGMVQGYNKWAREGKWSKAKAIALEELLLIHLMPDSLHFNPSQIETKVSEGSQCISSQENSCVPALGCTVVVDKDPQEGLVFGRNMDWPSFGIFGLLSLIINRKQGNGKFNTVEVSLPGFAGTLTGMNSNGISLAMNVAVGHTSKIRGMPAAFFNRLCLETSPDLKAVQTKIEQLSPLGPYHLTAADASAAKSFHFYQAPGPSHFVREWKEGNPLITTNCNYVSATERDWHMHHSEERHLLLDKLFREAVAADSLEPGKLVRGSLTLPYVNNHETTHKVVMCPQTKKIQVAFDNAFAGKVPLYELDTSELWSHIVHE